MLDQRGQPLRAALGFAGLPRPSYDRALHSLRSWLDSWNGLGAVVTGMECQGYDVGLGSNCGHDEHAMVPPVSGPRPFIGDVPAAIHSTMSSTLFSGNRAG
jgi:hypothetical protein